MEFLGKRAIPGVEEVSQRCYRRTARIARKSVVVQVVPEGASAVRVSVCSRDGDEDPTPVLCRVRHLFDLDASPEAIGARLSEDAALRPLVARTPGLRVPGAWEPFEIGVRAILGQQVSVKGASTLTGRFAERFGRPLSRAMCSETLRVLFPHPRAWAGSGAAEAIATIGVPLSRASSIAAFAGAFDGRSVSFEPDVDTTTFLRQLMAIKGIGPWTAHYVAMRARHDGDAFPAGDLILLRALSDAPPPKALEARAQRWRPWRAYAAMHLWRDYARVRAGAGGG